MWGFFFSFFFFQDAASPEIPNSQRKNKRLKIKPKKGKCVNMSGQKNTFSVPFYNVLSYIVLCRPLSFGRVVGCVFTRGGTEQLSADSG